MDNNESLIVVREFLDDILDQFSKQYFEHDFTFDENTFIQIERISGKYDLNLVKNKRQKGGALCGFHCLFNMMYFLQILKTDNDKRKHELYKRMCSPVK